MARKKPATPKRKPSQPGVIVFPDRIERWPLSRLIPYAQNALEHPPEQIAQIAGSMRAFGWTNPILADPADGDLIAGHGRVLAAHQLGLTEAPVIPLEHLTADEKRALRLADNRIGQNGQWNEELLKLELRAVAESGLDPAALGFAEDYLQRLLAEVTPGHTDPDDAPPIPLHPVTVAGDVWILGDHRLVCGDSTDATVVALCLGRVVPAIMVTDPPYGVEYDADWRNHALRTDGSPIAGRAIGAVSNDDRASWVDAFRGFKGPVVYCWHACWHASSVKDDLNALGFEIRAQIIWDKTRAVISRGHYHWQHEPCWYAVRKGKTAAWRGDRKQTTVWTIAHGKSETGHSTQKPVICMQRPVVNHTSPGQAVYDPFVGSGTTIIGCEQIGRACYGIDLDPAYVDVALTRWQKFTRREATLEGTDQTFAEVAAERGIEIPA